MTREQAEAIYGRIADCLTTCDECGDREVILSLQIDPDGRMVCIDCSTQDEADATTVERVAAAEQDADRLRLALVGPDPE